MQGFLVRWGHAEGPERQKTQTPSLCHSGFFAWSWRPGGPTGGGGSSIVKVPGDVPPARVYFFGLLV